MSHTDDGVMDAAARDVDVPWLVSRALGASAASRLPWLRRRLAGAQFDHSEAFSREVAEHARCWLAWLESVSSVPTQSGGEPYLVSYRPAGRPRATVVLLHGWPTSHLLFHRVIPLLVARDVGAVVIDLPGHGVSAALTDATIRGLSAAVLTRLDQAGHGPVVVHGQDWGSVVAAECGRLAPERVLGIHVSAGLAGFMGGLPEDLPAAEASRLGAYLTQQSVMPGPLQVALDDSPAGNLAWQIDKYRLWRPDVTHAEDLLGPDFLYGNATLSALSGSAGTALRVFHENRSYRAGPASGVPTAVSVFGHSDYADPDISAHHNTLTAFTRHDRGGHLAALEEPDIFAAEITALVDTVIKPRDVRTFA